MAKARGKTPKRSPVKKGIPLLDALGEGIAVLINLDQIADLLLGTLMGTFHLSQAILIVPEDKGSLLAVRYARLADGTEIKDKVGKNHALLLWAEMAHGVAIGSSTIKDEGLHAAFAMSFKGKIVGIMGLGFSRGNMPFSTETLSLLKKIADQTSIAIENAMAVRREREYIRRLSRAQARAEYAAELERTNQQLRETQDKLIKSERVSSISRLAVSLQHEINNPLTAVLATIQLLRIKMEKGVVPDPHFILERLDVAEKEARRIRRLVHNLQSITDPIVKDYLPGVEMIDIEALRGKEKS